MRVMHTPAGTRFGAFGEKPDRPAPTLFVFAVSVDAMAEERRYSEAGRQLAQHGWYYVTLDPPGHGHDHREGEPTSLRSWAHRVEAGEDLMAPFVARCVDVLDYLIERRFTDPDRVAACGTSRGGFCALHFAAAEPRVRAVAGISPVTNLIALREFAGMDEQQVHRLNVPQLADELAGHAVWLGIGNGDQRVGTDYCIAAARRLDAASRRRFPDRPVVPVELVVGPSQGHHPDDQAYTIAARFLLNQHPASDSE